MARQDTHLKNEANKSDLDGALNTSPLQPSWFKDGSSDILGTGNSTNFCEKPSISIVYGPADNLSHPPGYSAENIVDFDGIGWWYRGPHDGDICRISVLHRHCSDGGVKCKNDQNFQAQLSIAEYRTLGCTAEMFAAPQQIAELANPAKSDAANVYKIVFDQEFGSDKESERTKQPQKRSRPVSSLTRERNEHEVRCFGAFPELTKCLTSR